MQVGQNRPGEAEQTCKRLSELGDPNYKTVYVSFLMDVGKKDQAAVEMEKIFHSDSENRKYRSMLIRIYIAQDRMADGTKTHWNR